MKRSRVHIVKVNSKRSEQEKSQYRLELVHLERRMMIELSEEISPCGEKYSET